MAQVVWTQTGLDSFREIIRYIAGSSPANAEKVRFRLLKASGLLEDSPYLGQRVPEFDQDHVRELLVRPFRILYVVRGESCHIAYVVRGSRDLEKLVSLEDIEDA